MDLVQLKREFSSPEDASKAGVIPNLSVDCVVFGLADKKLKVLLVKHGVGESSQQWALPGGCVYHGESLDMAAQRLLKHLTGVDNVYLDQLKAFIDPGRVGGRHVITFAFSALVQPALHELTLPKEALDASWVDVHVLPALIYDHTNIVREAVSQLRQKVRYQPLGVNLLPDKFTLGQLQDLYEAILDQRLDKPNFRRKMLRMDFLVDCQESEQNVPHRAGKLYRFDQANYNALREKGFSFEF